MDFTKQTLKKFHDYNDNPKSEITVDSKTGNHMLTVELDDKINKSAELLSDNLSVITFRE